MTTVCIGEHVDLRSQGSSGPAYAIPCVSYCLVLLIEVAHLIRNGVQERTHITHTPQFYFECLIQ